MGSCSSSLANLKPLRRKRESNLNIMKNSIIRLKPLIEFTPHSLSRYLETKEDDSVKLILKHINLFYTVYKSSPPIKYLVFVMNNQYNEDSIKRIIQRLALRDWFTVVKRDQVAFSYKITPKFYKAFYHHLRNQGKER